uniref:Protocadherin 18a n=1 Tax=Callorhinchus milii TaxID=7868 RepID=A0A4W3GQX0_CALMI|eukprot:gi/632959901/ref/XP_007895889.1/ PREDICTED: protocadherin-18 [Callorhinchus milii]
MEKRRREVGPSPSPAPAPVRWLCLVLLGCLCREAAAITVKYRVYEEQPVGTVLGTLAETLADELNPSSQRFRVMQRLNSSLLAVREEDGRVSVAERIDRERLCKPHAAACAVAFDVITLPTEHLQLIQIEVEVLDINDNSPRFPRSVIPVEIYESASVGARFPLDSAVDPDVGDNSLHDYSLTPNEHFALEVRTRTDGAKYADLLVIRELDREQQDSYQLRLTASDNGVPRRSGSSLLKISVADSNDNSPVFEQTSYTIELLEDSPRGSRLLDLNATDADEGSNGQVIYSFSSHVSPQITDTFSIDPDSGHLTLLKSVDFEVSQTYEIDAQAQDLGPNSIPAHCKIIIKVVDVNDNQPEITISLMPLGKDVAYLSEAAPRDTFIALVRVQDKDSGLNGQVACHLEGHRHFWLQQTNEKQYIIKTNATLDREAIPEYSLKVIAEDMGSPSFSTIKYLTVQLTDENDNAPRFEKDTYELFWPENNSPGAYITSVTASDPDLGENGHVTYTILEFYLSGSSITTFVTIDPSNGAIYALRTFDYEEITRISFTVQARDGGSHQLTSNTTVVLTVIDQNDNAPLIVTPALRNGTAEVPLPMGTGAGYLVTTVAAVDKDSGANGELACTILDGNQHGIFTMDARTCNIYTNDSLSLVKEREWEIVVVVQDKGTPSLSTVATLKIVLTVPEDMSKSIIDDQSALDSSMIIIISLGVVCAVLLIIMAMFATRCNREKKDNRSYNCRVAESTYQHHPKRPSRQIHKGDITLVHTATGTLPIRSQHRASPSSSPTLSGMDRGQMCSRQTHHSRQSLNSLVTLSSNHLPENFALELTHASPPVEQVSQLLSMLHQGQYQPRPNFRGNKYSRSYRYALQDMDKFSLKDSGRGDSEAGDSDYDLGRDSPIDRLLGEGFSDLFVTDSHRFHPAMKLCTDECKVLGHSDQCWMPPLSSGVSADYRSNLFNPGEDTQQLQEDDCDSSDSSGKKKSFLTFGKESQSEEAEDLGTSSLLSEMNSVFQRLLPPQMDMYAECNETNSVSSLENKKGHLAAKTMPYPQGVAAWAASTNFQNPVSSVGLAPVNHVTPQPACKWLPAMEEIPENYEEDEFDNVLSQLNPCKRESKHELINASELVAEINKLLQDVRQS